MKFVIALASIALLAGCASSPPISQLSQGVSKVTLVKNGSAPLNYSTGVVDASSFWAAYGGGVSNQLGGGTLWQGLEKSGQNAVASKADQNREMVKKLFGNHDLAAQVNSAMLPQLAATWGTAVDPKRVLTLSDKPAYVDPKTLQLHGVETDADLVLMTEVANVNLTERFSMGGALAAGLTMGTNKKSLTTEVRVIFRAFKPDPAGAGYKQVWFQMCGPDYTTMKTSYRLEELMQPTGKMEEILNEATRQSIDLCSKALGTLNRGTAVAKNN